MEIIVAEDEAAIREVEVAYLNRAGYHTTEAANGAVALAAFKSRGADLLIVDLNMPGMDGLELCRRVRQTSTVPIVVVTAKDGDDDEVRGLEAGADDYIKKPFNPRVLVARVDALTRRRAHKRLTFEGLTIDPAHMTITRRGRNVALTTTQFNTLLALASQPGVVLTRDQLIEQVYDDPAGHDIYDRTIDAHIRSIRKAIENDPARPQLIQTVIGRGYKFNGRPA